MKLESLKNGKFEKSILSKAAMIMLSGGKEVDTAGGGDTFNYHCTGPDGSSYDRTYTDNITGYTKEEARPDMWPGTDSTWYE